MDKNDVIYIYMIYTYTMEYCSAIKIKSADDTMLSGISQREKCYIISLNAES